MVNNRERYYIISIYVTLLGDFCVERMYGASKNATPSGRIRSYHPARDEADKKLSSIMKTKISKGYNIICI